MTIKIIKTLALFTLTLSLIGCNNFFEKDNTPPPAPLPRITQTVSPKALWSARAGSGVGDEYLKETPTIDCANIYVASARGHVTSVNKITGSVNWKVNVFTPVTSGVGAGEGIVVVGSRKGQVVALQQSNGATLWRMNVWGEVLAKPEIQNGKVIIKTVNGYVRALDVADGHEIWSYQQPEPSLILRGSSAPLVRNNSVIVGFASGVLSKISLSDGEQNWVQTIAEPEGAFAIQRMIDIDADPIVFDHRIFAATYQGKIASLDWASGNIRWSQDLSSYTGMTANNDAVFISDARSYLWAFEADSGHVIWRQFGLSDRVVSGPAIMSCYIVVGDKEGYLHWLNQQDGRFAGHVKVGSAIYAAPIVENNVLYALTSSGNLVAYVL